MSTSNGGPSLRSLVPRATPDLLEDFERRPCDGAVIVGRPCAHGHVRNIRMEQVEAQQGATLHLVDDAAPDQGAHSQMLNLNPGKKGEVLRSNAGGQDEA
jgi:hypothetical protein